jgi:AcrR family transcriptional regulator
MELAAERGWDAVTTRQIAERAGVNQALIHYHFGSKEGLLHTAFELALRGMFAAPTDALLSAPSFAAGAAELVRALEAIDPSNAEALFSMEALSRATRDETVRRSMAAVLGEFRASVAERISAAQQAGELRPELDPEGTATALAALFDGFGLHLLIDRTIDVERTASAISALIGPPPTEHSQEAT